MRTYQIILKGGRTRYVLADGYKTQSGEIVFYTESHPAEHFENDAVLMVDELGEMPGFLTSLPTEVAMSIPFQ